MTRTGKSLHNQLQGDDTRLHPASNASSSSMPITFCHRRRFVTSRRFHVSVDWLQKLAFLFLISASQQRQSSSSSSSSSHAILSLVMAVEAHQMDLHPTALLVEERRRRLRNANAAGENGDDGGDDDDEQGDLPSHWFHPKSNSVYATLPKEEDQDHHDKSDELLDFHRYRHLSRWERQLRQLNGIDLDPNWNGTYAEEKEDDRDLQQQQMMHGGRYNNYASAPLSQGYGTHYTNLWVGSPKAQRKSVIVDTGSHYTAFPCKGCENCGEEHHTDPYFDPDLSQTFRALECNSCQLGANCRDQRCYFSQSYTEGSSWEAFQVEDLVYLGGRDMLAMADPRNTDYAIPFMFGCQTSENGLFVTQLADGIMGMSAHEYTLTKQLFVKGKIEHNLFALCFRRELGTSKKGVTAGVMTMGGIDNRLDLSPMLFAKNVASTGWFTVYVKNIFIRAGGGQRATSIPEPGQHVLKIPLDLAAVNSGKGVIVDSGTTDTYLHKKLAKSFASVWRAVTRKEYSHSGFLLSDDQLRRLPTILVQMRAHSNRVDPALGSPTETIGFAGGLDPTSPYDILLAIPATNYMEYSPTTGLYTSRLYFTETQGGVLGANAMQGHNVVFDWENGRVGFAESSCDYEDEHSAQKVHQGVSDIQRFGNDCVLGKSILTHLCVESVDSQSCDGQTVEFLEGIEVWTRTVETFGSDSGMSCQDVVLLDTPHQGQSPPQVTCANGLCEEYRPCRLSCKEVGAENVLLAVTQGQACPAAWSSCDQSCTQSFVQAIEKRPGVCYESSRSTRDCHTGDCGKDDPCTVPYLVHATLGFNGANQDKWTPAASESLVQAVASSISRIGKLGDTAISGGDVNIMMVSPWREDSDDIGLKVVLQISFFNAKATILNPQTEQSNGNRKRKLPTQPSDIQQLFQRPKQKSICTESDLYPLANNALAAHDAFKKDEFMRTLIGELKKSEGGDQNYSTSPFASLYSKNELIAASQVISAWTIRTEIEETGGVRKGILDMGGSPLKSYSISGRTIWLTLTGIGLLILYAADRYMTSDRDDGNDVDYDDDERSRRYNARYSVGHSTVDDSDEALFKQLFRPNGSFDDDDISHASSTLLGSSVVSERRARSEGGGDIELASRKMEKISRIGRRLHR